MARSSKYIHYLQRIDVSGQPAVDIEDNWKGLLYLKAEGLQDIGGVKNYYTEEYADSDRLRVYYPFVESNGQMEARTELIANEATTITMTFLVVGSPEARENIIQGFLDEIRTGIHRYWDTARYREFDFIVTDEIKASDEKWHGSQPYVEIQIPMQNLNGKTRQHLIN